MPIRRQATLTNAHRLILGLPSFNAGYETYSGGISYTRPVGARLVGSASVSYTDLKISFRAIKGFTGFTYSAALTYSVSPRLTAQANIARATLPSNRLNSVFRIDEDYSGEVDYRLTKRGVVRLGASYEHDSYGGITTLAPFDLLDEKIYTGFVSAEYRLNRRLSVDLGVDQSHRDANFPGLTLRRHQGDFEFQNFILAPFSWRSHHALSFGDPDRTDGDQPCCWTHACAAARVGRGPMASPAPVQAPRPSRPNPTSSLNPAAAASPTSTSASSPSAAVTAPAPDDKTYILGPSDVVEVSVLGRTDYTTRTRIDENGDIQLQYLGAVKAAGRTTEQLSAQIAQALQKGGFFANPIVQVNVSSYASRYVTVLGT